jgi:hypothetical protein
MFVKIHNTFHKFAFYEESSDMTSQIKRKKNLGRTLAVLAIIGSFVGLTSLPAFAYEDSWTLEVNVSDTTCTAPPTDPTWSPNPSVIFLDGNDVDTDPFSANPPRLIAFYVELGIEAGLDNCTTWNIEPSGTIVAEVTLLDPELSMEILDCTGGCGASTLWSTYGTISGTIDASEVTTPGLKTGTLAVVWTPAD